MNATEVATHVPADIMADAQLVAECVAAGRPIPAEVVCPVQAASRKITQAIYEKFGLVDIAVPATRELRGELPQP